MEGILAIAAIIIIIVRMVKASENKQKKQNENQPQVEQQRPIAPQADPFEQFKRIQTLYEERPERDRNFEGVMRPGGEGYNQTHVERNDYSKYPESTKGFVSMEGTESFEGKCIEPDANHCAVEHLEDSVYASEIGMEENAFTHEDIVKGIIMAEILSKPKSLQ